MHIAAVGTLSGKNEHDGSDSRHDERRRAERHAARDLCEIIVDRSGYAVPCLVHNISDTGALIESNDKSLPDRFILTNYTRGERVVCRVAWRKGSLLGVRFANPPRSTD